jgi:predicted Zn-dependent protease
MERDAALETSERRRSHFFDSHPATEDRVQKAAKHAANVAVGAPDRVARDRSGTLAQLTGLQVGENPAYGVFLDDRFAHPALGFSLDFPAGWKTLNQPLYVVGVAPQSEQRAFAMLQLAAEGSDPREGAKADGLDPTLVPSLELIHVNGLPATRVISAQKQATFHLTWIALGDAIYRVACVAETAQWPRYERACESTAGSFRRLSGDDRKRIREERLRVVAARPGENLGGVVGRAGSSWDPNRAAIANALAGPAAVIPSGFGVKIAVSRPYAPSQ